MTIIFYQCAMNYLWTIYQDLRWRRCRRSWYLQRDTVSEGLDTYNVTPLPKVLILTAWHRCRRSWSWGLSWGAWRRWVSWCGRRWRAAGRPSPCGAPRTPSYIAAPGTSHRGSPGNDDEKQLLLHIAFIDSLNHPLKMLRKNIFSHFLSKINENVYKNGHCFLRNLFPAEQTTQSADLSREILLEKTHIKSIVLSHDKSNPFYWAKRMWILEYGNAVNIKLTSIRVKSVK